jgi:hypothetical protein
MAFIMLNSYWTVLFICIWHAIERIDHRKESYQSYVSQMCDILYMPGVYTLYRSENKYLQLNL